MFVSGLLAATVVASTLVLSDQDRDDALTLGRMLLEMRDFEGASLHLEALVERDPADLEYQFMLGLSYFGAGRYEEARTPFETVAGVDPDDSLPWEFLGRVEFQLGRLGDAVSCLERAAAIDPRGGRTHNHLGAVLVRMERREEALAAFRTALEYDPSFAVAHYNIGVLAALADDPLAGVYHLREAARLDPADADATKALGDLRRRLGDYAEALEWFDETARREPGVAAHQLAIGDVHELLGAPLEAELAFARACELSPDQAEPYLHLAAFLARAARVRDAKLAYRAALQRNEGSLVANKGLADLAEDAGDDALARRHLERILEDGFVHPELLRRLCFACERLGDHDGALAAYRRLVLESDGDDASLRAVAECMALSSVEGIRDVPRGRDLAAALVKRSGERSAAALYVLSRAEAAAGNPAAAAKSLESAAALFHAQGPEAVLLRRLSEQARAGR